MPVFVCVYFICLSVTLPVPSVFLSVRPLPVCVLVYLCFCPSVYMSSSSVCLFVCLFARPSPVCLLEHLCFRPSVCCLPVFFVYLSVCLSIYLSVCLSFCLSVCLFSCLSICFLRLFVCLSVFLSVCPSVYLSVPVVRFHCVFIKLSLNLSVYFSDYDYISTVIFIP